MSDSFNEDNQKPALKPKRRRRGRKPKQAHFHSTVTNVADSVDAVAEKAAPAEKVGKVPVTDVIVEVVEDNVYVGFSESTQEWYGWRNDLVAKGFKQGDRLDASGLPEGFVAHNLEQARKLAVAYARTA